MATLAMFFRRPLAAPAARSGAAQSAFVPVDDRYCLRSLPYEDIVLYSKPIDNSRIVREPRHMARGEWSMIGTAGLLAFVWLLPNVAELHSNYQAYPALFKVRQTVGWGCWRWRMSTKWACLAALLLAAAILSLSRAGEFLYYNF